MGYPEHLNRCAFAGISATDFSSNSGHSELTLAVQAATAAAADAGIGVAQIDGIVQCDMDFVQNNAVADALGLPNLCYRGDVGVGGGAPAAMVGQAVDEHVCDPQQLVAFLNSHQDKAEAWARVLGTAPGGIDRYVASLTPIVLTGDTLVGNHGYRDGAPTSLLSVLQAGTAVMVDASGTPRVKCNCGNPLTSPQLVNLGGAHSRGAPWPGYTPAGVTAVRPGRQTDTLQVVNISTGALYDQPIATPTTGSDPGLWVAAETDAANAAGHTTIVRSGDGRVWSAAGVIASANVMALAWGHGSWIAALAKDGSHLRQRPVGRCRQ